LSKEAELEAVRIVISGAARARSRVGKQLLAKMLCGSQSTQVSRLRLHELSTFGLLKELRQREALEIIDGLVNKGLLEQLERQKRRPVVRVTDEGAKVMRGEAPLSGSLPLSAELQWKLQARYQVAETSRQRPPAPKTVPGVEPRDDAPPPSESVVPRPHSSTSDPVADPEAEVSDRPNHYWTWRLLSDHYAMPQVLRIRRIDEETALDHLLRASEDGLEVRLDWLLSPEQLESLEKTVGHGTPRHLRHLMDELPPNIRHEHLQLYLRCRQSGGTTTVGRG
jgi:ATP-dependent DNA helicase RecQ